MKKLFSLIFAVIIVLALPAFTVSAAYSAELTVSETEAKQGETAEVLISIANNPGLCALGFEVEYDKDALKVISAEFTDLFSAASGRVNTQDGKIIFNAASADNINGDGTVAKIVFRLEANGTFTVNAKPLGNKGFVLHSESDHSLRDVTLNIKAGHVTTAQPVTDAPITDAPVTQTPATDAPATDAPATDAPATDAPATDAPVTACMHSKVESETVKSSTCTSKGVALTRCADCGISLGETELPMTDHTPGEWTVTIEPTMVSEGEQVQNCTVCHYLLKTQTLPKLSDGIDIPSEDDGPDDTERSGVIVIVIVAAVLVIAGAIAAFVVINAKRNREKEEEEDLYF